MSTKARHPVKYYDGVKARTNGEGKHKNPHSNRTLKEMENGSWWIAGWIDEDGELNK